MSTATCGRSADFGLAAIVASLFPRMRVCSGRMRPGRLVMQDALRKDEESVLEYRDMRMRDLPDKMFSKDYLKHLD